MDTTSKMFQQGAFICDAAERRTGPFPARLESDVAAGATVGNREKAIEEEEKRKGARSDRSEKEERGPHALGGKRIQAIKKHRMEKKDRVCRFRICKDSAPLSPHPTLFPQKPSLRPLRHQNASAYAAFLWANNVLLENVRMINEDNGARGAVEEVPGPERSSGASIIPTRTEVAGRGLFKRASIDYYSITRVCSTSANLEINSASSERRFRRSSPEWR
ncbi:hypothetical protein L596_018555 [Steinernema carpocapsae]|uniref:Uncharacterized protein n=1 Tax=Steinernema carpocapsae TaxID=34508 RepID=A0A4U5N620_STECR|nr:hypothetical protein L596_018555 [Steinernema carpocapsae]